MKYRITFLAFAFLIALPTAQAAKEPKALTDIFAKYDKNGDHQLSAEELTKYLEENGGLGKAFAKMDADKSGTVTTGERDKAVSAQAAEDISSYGDGVQTKMDPELADGYFKLTNKEYAQAIEEERKASDPFLRFFGEDFHVRNSLLVDPAKIDKPATLGLSWDGSSDNTSYFLDGALQYEINMANGVIAPTVEAHISDDKKATRDSLTLGVPFWFVFNPGADAITEAEPGHLGTWNGVGHTVQVNPLYVRDRVGDLETFQLGVVYTPTIPALGIGNRALGPFTWRPYFGLDYVHVIDSTPATLAKLGDEDLLRPFAKVSGSFDIIPRRWVITGSIIYRHQFSDVDDNFLYYSVASDLYLDKDQHFSLNVSYENGENEPAFAEVEFLRASIGIKF